MKAVNEVNNGILILYKNERNRQAFPDSQKFVSEAEG